MRRQSYSESEGTGRTALVLGPVPAFPPAQGPGPHPSMTRPGPIRIAPRTAAPRCRLRDTLIDDGIGIAQRVLFRVQIATAALLLGVIAQIGLAVLVGGPN